GCFDRHPFDEACGLPKLTFGADFLLPQRLVSPCALIRSAPPVRRCDEFSKTFGEHIVVGEAQPALLHIHEVGFRGLIPSRFRPLLVTSSTLMTLANQFAQPLKHATDLV